MMRKHFQFCFCKIFEDNKIPYQKLLILLESLSIVFQPSCQWQECWQVKRSSCNPYNWCSTSSYTQKVHHCLYSTARLPQLLWWQPVYPFNDLFEDRPSGCTQAVQHCEEYRLRSTVFHLPHTGPLMPSGVKGRRVVEPGDFGLVVVWLRSLHCCLVRGMVLLYLTCVGFLMLGCLSVLGDSSVRGANRGWDELTGLTEYCICFYCCLQLWSYSCLFCSFESLDFRWQHSKLPLGLHFGIP